MPSHTSHKMQHAVRRYQVVTVSQGGKRKIITQHDSFQVADRVRKLYPSEEGVEIRIESVAECELPD